MISRGIRNNNPFNIRISHLNHWLGKVKRSENSDGEFEQFISMKYGLRAGVRLLRNYYFKHNIVRLEDYIRRFAPSSENDTEKYIYYVVNFINSYHFSVTFSTEVFPFSILFWRMIQAILMYESKYEVSIVDLLKAYNYA